MSKTLRNEVGHIESADGLVFEGIVSLRALLDAQTRPILRVLVSEARVKKQPKELGFLKAKSVERDFSLEVVDDATIASLATGNTHGGLIAICGEREISAPTNLVENGFYVMLEGVEDPYNFGYALRSLYAAGVDGVILPPRSWMSAAGIVCRASAGASERLTLFTASPEDVAEIFKSSGYRIVAADIENSVSVYDANLRKPLLLVVGGEKRGISAPLLNAADTVVRLDYGREFDAALSAASAASILAFEVFRVNR